MIVVEKKPVPLYETECYECKSRLRYKAAEVSMCHIVCPVCGVPLWAATVSPVGFEEDEAKKDEFVRRIMVGDTPGTMKKLTTGGEVK